MDEPSTWEINLLLRQAWHLQESGQYGRALDTAGVAREAARQVADLGAEIRAAGIIAISLQLGGDHGAAYAQYTEILGVSRDPAREAAIEQADVQKVLTMAYIRSVDTALYLPDIAVAPLMDVLDAGDAYVRTIGKPEWRAGLLLKRARVLEALGRLDEALIAAEEALQLEIEHGSAPGATLAAHRLTFGGLLREASRYGDAARQYEAVLNGRLSTPADHVGAHVGLARCHLATSDPRAAHGRARHALYLAERMGDELLSLAFHACADVCLALEDVAGARAASDRALECARRLRNTYRLYFAVRNAAKVALAENDVARARALIDEAGPHAEAFDRARGRTTQQDLMSSLRASADRGAEAASDTQAMKREISS